MDRRNPQGRTTLSVLQPDRILGSHPNPGAGVSAESRVTDPDAAGVGGARTTAQRGGEIAGDLRRSARPADGASQRGVVVAGDEDDQRQRGRGQRTDTRNVVAVDCGAETPPRTL